MTRPWTNSEILRIINDPSFLSSIRYVTSPRTKSLLTQNAISTFSDLVPKQSSIESALKGLSYGKMASTTGLALAQPITSMFPRMNSALAAYGAAPTFTNDVYQQILGRIRSGEVDIDEASFDYSEVAPEIEAAITSIASDGGEETQTTAEERKAARLYVTWTLALIWGTLLTFVPFMQKYIENVKASKPGADAIWDWMAARFSSDDDSETDDHE